eukprot:CAMPEP_0116841002 /NCGR_PEP_ID=MMETSP0418-20121206/10679_1 /TAXON_ID=1158023 /ORGANISM="Astrosyne radiata, Strain 13vi08-1A" /LENGTH=252 /DNA_ID=CAMNT_0004471373 /DNA_START=16 /DNA_END=774 /DNA_ORIENTATION=+
MYAQPPELFRVDSAGRCSSPDIESTINVREYNNQKDDAKLLLQAQQTPPRPARRVRFNESVRVEETIHVRNMSAWEIDNTWLKREDFKRIRGSFSTTMQILSHQEEGPIRKSFICYHVRGLEAFTTAGSRLRNFNRRSAVYSVLEEQDRQRELGISNDRVLGHMYTASTWHCSKEAQIRGLQDQLDALKIHYRSYNEEEDEEDSDELKKARAQRYSRFVRKTVKKKQALTEELERLKKKKKKKMMGKGTRSA